MTLKVNGQKIPDKAILAELKRLMEFYGQHMPREELGRHVTELVERAREHPSGRSCWWRRSNGATLR